MVANDSSRGPLRLARYYVHKHEHLDVYRGQRKNDRERERLR